MPSITGPHPGQCAMSGHQVPVREGCRDISLLNGQAQGGRFLERYRDVTEQGSELLVGLVGTMARMDMMGTRKSPISIRQYMALWVSRPPLNSLVSCSVLSLCLCISLIFLCLSSSVSIFVCFSLYLPVSISEAVSF